MCVYRKSNVQAAAVNSGEGRENPKSVCRERGLYLSTRAPLDSGHRKHTHAHTHTITEAQSCTYIHAQTHKITHILTEAQKTHACSHWGHEDLVAHVCTHRLKYTQDTAARFYIHTHTYRHGHTHIFSFSDSQ